MSTGTSALRKSIPGHDTFRVVKLAGGEWSAEAVTVLHHVPPGAAELASFEDPNRALDFAEATVRTLAAGGTAIELVDPPYGLVGAG